jgi:hypothetical protein
MSTRERVAKYASVFPVMNLDAIGINLPTFFPRDIQSTGGHLLTNDRFFSMDEIP